MAACCFCAPLVICGDVCKGITIDTLAPVAGVYTLYYDYFLIGQKIEKTFTANEPLFFDSSKISPIYNYKMQLLINDNHVSFKDNDDNIYDHLLIRAQINSGKIITKPLTIII
jgi:hypothetical protein